MAMNIPYEAALKMPESFALALLTGGRPQNTRPTNTDLFKPVTPVDKPDTGRRLIAQRRAKQDKT